MKTRTFVADFAVLFLGLIFTFVLSGCAGVPPIRSNTAATCENTNSNAKLRSGEYQKKVENFIIVLDASSTMGEHYGKTFSYGSSKLDRSQDMVRCLNNSLPDDFNVNAGMRVFGPINSDKGLIHGINRYAKTDIDTAVRSINGTGGVTPLANAIIYGGYDFLDTPGLKDIPQKTAMIIFSDGLNTQPEDPVVAASTLKEMYGNNICIYTVLLGKDPNGRKTMEQIASAGKCGFATDLETIGNAQGMEQFVTDVFLTKAEKKQPPQVVKEQPPVVQKTVEKMPVEKVSITLYIEFDFDKATIRPQHHDDIKKLADFLKMYPDTNAALEGHTDSIGTDAYNMGLSKRRAESVKNYLVEKFNVNGSRISTAGYGESRPVATNDTKVGRQKNRRVMALIQ